MSSQHPVGTASARHYAQAHASHYTHRDLLGAVRAYDEVIELYPNTPEAEYSRTQIRNIVNVVVPARELLAFQITLVRRYLQPVHDESAATVSL